MKADWKTIDSAPDESDFWATDGKWSAVCYKSDGIFKFVIDHWAVSQECEWNPTHWDYLPEGPEC